MILCFTCYTLLVVAACPQHLVHSGNFIDLVKVLKAFWPEMASIQMEGYTF